MPITFPCPHCGQELTAPDQAAGQSGKCRFCNAVIQAPLAPGQPAGLVQPGAVAPPPPSPPYGEGAAGSPGAPGAPGAPAGAGWPGAESTYTPPPTYQVGYPSAPVGEVRPGLIFGEAWQVTTANWGILAGAAVIAMLITTVPIFFFAMLGPVFYGASPGSGSAWVPDAWIVLAFLAMLLFGMPVYLGTNSMGIELLTRGETSIATMFSPYRRFGKLVVTLLLLAVATAPIWILSFAAGYYSGAARAGLGAPGASAAPPFELGPAAVAAFVLLVLFSGYLMVGLMWAPFEVLDRDAAPMDAIRDSWSSVEGKRLAVFFTMLLFGILNTIGSYCCIAWLFTTPLMTVGTVITYRQLRGLKGNLFSLSLIHI